MRRFIFLFDSKFYTDEDNKLQIFKSLISNLEKYKILYFSDKVYTSLISGEKNSSDFIRGLPENELNEPLIRENISNIQDFIFNLEPNSVVVTFGKTVWTELLKNFLPDVFLGKSNFDDLVGEYVSLNNSRIYCLNHISRVFDSSYIFQKTRLSLENIIYYFNNGEEHSDFKILNPTESLNKITEIIDLYKSGDIPYVFHDTETHNFDIKYGSIIMHSLSHDKDNTSYSLPLQISNINHHEDKKTADGQPAYPYKVDTIDFDVSKIEATKINKMIGVLCKEVPIIGHNWIGFDLPQLQANDIITFDEANIYDDSLITSYLIFGRQFGHDLKLKSLARALFNVSEDWEKEIEAYLNLFRLTKDRLYSNIPTLILGKYAAYDTHYNKLIYRLIKNLLPEDMKNIHSIILDGFKIFSSIRVKGVKIDTNLISFLDKKYSKFMNNYFEENNNMPTVIKYKNDKIKEIQSNYKGRKPFDYEKEYNNIFSMSGRNCQLDLMFGKEYFNLPVLTYTEKNLPSMGEDALINLLNNYKNLNEEQEKYIRNILGFRKFSKLQSTYISNYHCENTDGFTYPYYNITGAITGRISSAFHTLPKSSNIKRAVISRWKDSGGIVLSADYSQLELRIIGAISKDENLIEAYKADVDLHTFSGAKALGLLDINMDIHEALKFLKTIEIKKEHRQVGKTMNFAVNYQAGAEAVAEKLNCTVEEAQNYLNVFRIQFPALHKWIDGQKDYVHKNGYIKTVFGRKIDIPDIHSTKAFLVSGAERAAVNYPIQSAGSDYVMLSITLIDKFIKENNLKSLLIGSVHDSILLDVYPGELPILAKNLKDICEKQTADLCRSWLGEMPIKLDIGIGTSWGGAIEPKENTVLDDNYIDFYGKALNRDIEEFISSLEKGYDCKLKILESEDIDLDTFEVDDFIRDTVKSKFRLKIFPRN